MCRLVLLCIALLCLSLNSNAQKHGYLGKKVYFTFDYNFFPNAQPNGRLEYLVSNIFFFGGSYKVSNKAVAGLKYGYSPTGISLSSLRIPGDSVDVVEEFKASFHLLEFHYTHFFPHGAPSGSYVSYSLGVSRFSYRDDYIMAYDRDHYYGMSEKDIRVKTPVLKNMHIGIEFGKQRILFDKLVLRTGSKISILPTQIFNAIRTENYSSMYPTIKQSSEVRLAQQVLFDFTLGIGFLAF